MKRAALAAVLALAPGAAFAHPHIIISQAVRGIETDGAYTHIEIVWKFDPHASEDEIPAIDENKDGSFSDEEIRSLARDMMPEIRKVGFLTWFNTGGADFRPPSDPAFAARIDDPATFDPPDWDRGAGDGMAMPDNKRAEAIVPPEREKPRNLVYTMRFALPQPVKSFTVTTLDTEDYMRFEVDKSSVPAGCTLDKHPTYKSEFVPGRPVFADRVSCRLP